MFSRTKEKTPLDREIERVTRNLLLHEIGSEEYVKTLDCLTKLHKLKTEEEPSSVSKDTLANIGANLLGIFMIIKHESVNVITSKAMSFVIRAR